MVRCSKNHQLLVMSPQQYDGQWLKMNTHKLPWFVALSGPVVQCWFPSPLFVVCFKFLKEKEKLMNQRALGLNLVVSSQVLRLLALPDGGIIFKNIIKYQTKGDAHIPGEEIKRGKEKTLAMFKAVEARFLI
ncbi:unnamed protein product [Thlaspi arvense]|uniref:Uncharacterized protein n=1 Tax=Thlaspi arvense TaxID=13288 RepID=A0AAU9S382_THLAR|nr:unnamed protein product [Thlaspi arvense]